MEYIVGAGFALFGVLYTTIGVFAYKNITKCYNRYYGTSGTLGNVVCAIIWPYVVIISGLVLVLTSDSGIFDPNGRVSTESKIETETNDVK